MPTLKSHTKRKGYWKIYEKVSIKDYRKVWNITKEIVKKEGVPFKLNKRGRPPKLELWMYVDLAVLYVYFNDPFRETEQLLNIITNKRLDHSNIIRWFGKLNRSYIDKLTYKVHLEIIKQSNEGDYIADSSGVTCDRYQETIHRGKKIKELVHWKLHIFAQYLFILGLVSVVSVWSTHGDVNDSPIFRNHLLKSDRVEKDKRCHGDKAYFGKKNIRKTRKCKLIPNLVPKKWNYTDSDLKKAVKDYDDEARKKNRGLVETPFGGLETEMQMRIRCRKPHHRNLVTCLLGLKHDIKTLLRAKALSLFSLFSHQPRIYFS